MISYAIRTDLNRIHPLRLGVMQTVSVSYKIVGLEMLTCF